MTSVALHWTGSGWSIQLHVYRQLLTVCAPSTPDSYTQELQLFGHLHNESQKIKSFVFWYYGWKMVRWSQREWVNDIVDWYRAKLPCTRQNKMEQDNYSVHQNKMLQHKNRNFSEMCEF